MGLLHAYIIGVDTVGTDIEVWDVADQSGNEAFVSTVSGGISGYEDISGIITWDQFYDETEHGVANTRTEIQDAVDLVGFNSLTLEEQIVASRWFVVPKSDRDTVHTDDEQEENAEWLAEGLLAEGLIDNLTSVTTFLLTDITIVNTHFSTYDLFYNATFQTWNDYDERKLIVDTPVRENPLYTVNISGDGINILEEGEYALSVDISLLSDQQNLGCQAWIEVNDIEVEGTRGHLYITDSSGQTISTQTVIVLETDDEISLVAIKSDEAQMNRYLQQTINGTRLLVRRN